MKIITRRFETIPAGEPTDYVVGFEYSLDNGRSFYLEQTVSLEDAAGKTDHEIANIAYARLEERAGEREAELSGQSPLVNQEFIPPGTPLGGNQAALAGRQTRRRAQPDKSAPGISTRPSRRAERAAAIDPDADLKKLTES